MKTSQVHVQICIGCVDALCPSQQLFRYVRTFVLKVGDKMPCSRNDIETRVFRNIR